MSYFLVIMREDDDAPDVYSMCSHFVGAKITSFVQLVCDIAGVICAAWEAGEEFGVCVLRWVCVHTSDTLVSLVWGRTVAHYQ